jgi:hypothetical protein
VIGTTYQQKTNVERHLNAFYGGPFNHNLGGDGPDDADDDAAEGSIYAAQAFCSHQGDSYTVEAGRPKWKFRLELVELSVRIRAVNA